MNRDDFVPTFRAPLQDVLKNLLLRVQRLIEARPSIEFEARTGLALAGIAAPLARLRAQGLMEENAARLCTTARGFRYLNAVLAEFA